MAVPAASQAPPLHPFDDAYVDALSVDELRRELKERNEHFRLLAERSPDLVVLSTAEGTWHYVNGRAREALGFEPEELANVSFCTLMHPEEQELLTTHHQRVLTSPEEFASLEHQVRGKDGRYRWVTAAIQTARGDTDRRHVLVIDRFEGAADPRIDEPFIAAHRNFRTLAEASIDMIARHTPDQRVIYVSPAATTLLGVTPVDLIGSDPSTFCHPDDLPALGTAYHVLSTRNIDDGFSFDDTRLWLEIRGSMARVRCRLRHAGGHYVWCEQVVTALRSADGSVEEFVTVTRDITRVKLHERELESINRRLEERIEERTAALAASNDELRTALDALENTRDKLVQAEKLSSLGELVAGIAHEVNTPVGVGLTAASHLRDRAEAFARAVEDGALTRRALAEFVGTATDSANITCANLQRAAELIRSFKQVAADRNDESIREVDLAAYLSEVLISLRPQLRRDGHVAELRGTSPLPIVTAPGALSQVVTNFVMNSIRHGFEGREGGRIVIDVERSESGGCVLHISDDGAGIPESHLKRIFDPFFTTKRGNGGTGLGLNIVYGLVTNVLQGSIDVESTIDAGTTFTISLPARIDPDLIPAEEATS